MHTYGTLFAQKFVMILFGTCTGFVQIAVCAFFVSVCFCKLLCLFCGGFVTVLHGFVLWPGRGSNPPASIVDASPGRGIRTLKGSGKRIFPGRRGDSERSERQRGRAPMEICMANLGSRPKAGIPPPPVFFRCQRKKTVLSEAQRSRRAI